MTVEIIVGDCREKLRTLASGSVHCVVSSPPYFGLRDYGMDGQMGLEPTPSEFVDGLVRVFREVRRVLRDDGTLWLNLGDSYTPVNRGEKARPRRETMTGIQTGNPHSDLPTKKSVIQAIAASGLKQKDLIGIPWRVAFALQADGWYLRQDIIWHKPNPMPESVTDRCTKSHEYVFLLAKSSKYHYDAKAISEEAIYANDDRKGRASDDQKRSPTDKVAGIRPRKSVPRGGFDGKTNALEGREAFRAITERRNKRSVWSIATQPYSEAHFAVMAPELARTCVLAGCPEGGTVLDPFGGAGTTGLVADRLQRNAILIELNPAYAEIARRRIYQDAPLLVADSAPLTQMMEG